MIVLGVALIGLMAFAGQQPDLPSAAAWRLGLAAGLAGLTRIQYVFVYPEEHEIVIAGQYFHTGAPVVLWTDPGGYDAYRTERRFVPWERAGDGWEVVAGEALVTPAGEGFGGGQALRLAPDDAMLMADLADVVHASFLGGDEPPRTIALAIADTLCRCPTPSRCCT